MKPKYTMALAVLAVAFMLGSALVPLAAAGGSDTESTAVTYNITNDGVVSNDMFPSGPETSLDILDLLNTYILMGSSVPFLKSDTSSTLVPVSNNTDYSKMSKWDGSNVTDTSVVGLYEGAAASVGYNAIIGAGATLVLFPVGVKTDLSFTLECEDWMSYILLNDGAYLDIFGLKFKVVCQKSDDKYCLSTAVGKVKVESSVKDGKFTANFEIGADSSIDLFVGKFLNTTEIDQTADNASVKIAGTPVAGEDGTSMNNISVSIDSMVGSPENGMKMIASMNISSLSAVNTTLSVDEGRMSISFGTITGSITEKQILEKETVTMEAKDLSIPAGKIIADVYAMAVTVDEENKLSFTSAISASLDDYSTSMTASEFKFNSMAKAENVSLDFDSIKIKTIQDPVKKSNEVKVDIEGDAGLAADKMEMALFVFGGMGVSGPVITITDLSASISDALIDIITNSDGNKVIVNIGGMSFGANIFLDFMALSVRNISLATSGLEIDATLYAKAPKVTIKDKSSSFSADVSFPAYLNYPVSISASSSEDSLTYENNALTASSEEMHAKVSVRYDGLDRAVSADITGLVTTMNKEAVNKEMITVTSVSIAEANISCNVPFNTMSLFTKDSGITINVNVNISVYGKNVSAKMKGSDITVEGDELSADSKTPIPVAPYIEEISVKAEGFKIAGTELEANKITGFLKNYGESNQNFSINPKGDSVPTVSFSYDGTIRFVKGSAQFAAGFIPAKVVVEKDMVFVADGLSAVSFEFSKGCILSGVVALDTKEYISEGSRYIIYDGKSLLTLNPSKSLLATDGYKALFDIGTLGGGKLIACNGTMIPDWKSEYGTQWVRSEDGSTATYDTGTGAVFCFETQSKAFKFQYEGENAVEKLYGETITLKEAPAKTGLVATGWTDGSGETYKVGGEYRMPARDVVLTPLYEDVAPNTSVQGTELVVSSDKASAVLVASSTVEQVQKDGTLTIGVQGAKVTMEQKTIDSLKAGQMKTEMGFKLSVNKADEFNDELKKNIVGNGTMYNISLTDEEGNKLAYSNDTTFSIKLDVKVSGKVDHFNISYLSDSYETHAVGMTGFSQSDDQNCTVSFECNHFSDYVIEPVYKSPDWGFIAMVIVLAVIIVALVFFAASRVAKAPKY